MTIAELIQALSKFPDSTEVCVETAEPTVRYDDDPDDGGLIVYYDTAYRDYPNRPVESVGLVYNTVCLSGSPY